MKTSTSTRPVTKTLAALAGAAALLALAGCQKHPPAAKPKRALPTATVKAQVVSAKKHRALEEVVGTVRAKQRAVLEAKVRGRIVKLHATLGQKVKRGQLLARLDVAEIGAKVRQARAVLQQAKAELGRVSALVKQQAATRQEYDAVLARYRVAQASLSQASTMVGYARVTAPFAGVVTRKNVEVGDLAQPGKPLIVVEDPSALRLEIGVPEALIGFIEKGKKLTVRVANIKEPVSATVAEVAPTADPNSRTFVVKLDLPQSKWLRSGQFGRALIPAQRTKTMRVPLGAIVRRGQLEMVFVVGKGGTAKMRLVKTGKRFANRVELVSGVDSGERIVTSGAANLRDGQPVQVAR